MPATFGLADSMSQDSSGAWAPSPCPSPNCPAGSFRGAPVNVTPGHDLAIQDLLELRAERAHLVEEVLDGGRVAVSRDERVERMHQMPGRAVELRLVARMDVLRRSAAPFRSR